MENVDIMNEEEMFNEEIENMAVESYNNFAEDYELDTEGSFEDTFFNFYFAGFMAATAMFSEDELDEESYEDN